MAQRCGDAGWDDTDVMIKTLDDGSSRELTDEERAALVPPPGDGGDS